MEDKNWEESLKGMLNDYKPEGLRPDWAAFANYLSVHEQISEWEEDEVFDESIKDSVSGFQALPMAEGWDRVESSLNMADRQFDENIRNKINQFEPHYSPGYWSMFMQRLSGVSYLRAKLIAFKVVEVAAVFLILFTALKLGQMGKLPFETPLFDSPKESFAQGKKSGVKKNQVTKAHESASVESSSSLISEETSSTGTNDIVSGNATDDSATIFALSSSHALVNEKENNRNAASVDPILFNDILPVKTDQSFTVVSPQDIALSEELNSSDDEDSGATGKSLFKKLQVANFLGTILSPIRWNREKSLPKLAYVKQRSRKYTEFGIISQLDYNKLRMPEDRLYSAGRQIIFPQQGIPSANLGGGFSFAIAHPRWAIESGLIYSAKNFRPGRELVVGGALNNGSVEFDAMRLQMVSLPLLYRYKFDHKGAFKVYGLAGFGLNLIAKSNIDVVIEYEFPSLSQGDDPNKDPNLGPIIKETRRISEHIRDGAPFSTKSFVSFEAGLGMEYSIHEHKTLFLQSAVQYQVPNLRFSNNNGKHIRSVTLQAGVRAPLGN